VTQPLPAGPFGCIYADPPWAFRTFSGENMTPHRCAEDHYRTMTFDELAALPVGDVAAKDCALFMWVVGSHLAESIALASAWGFTFKTDAFYWVKQRLVGADQIDLFTGDVPEPRMGFGYWTRKQVEPCWLFTRGNPRRLGKGVRQVILEPRREHSRKPEEARERIEALVGGPYLELFARTTRPGWSAWGNETEKFGEAA
jgi:N6-adenosine-specific RNA methylase IME4